MINNTIILYILCILYIVLIILCDIWKYCGILIYCVLCDSAGKISEKIWENVIVFSLTNRIDCICVFLRNVEIFRILRLTLNMMEHFSFYNESF